MDQLIEFAKGFNIQTIISIALISWYFTSGMKNEMKSIEAKLEERMAKQEARTDRLYEMFIDLLKEEKAKG